MLVAIRAERCMSYVGETGEASVIRVSSGSIRQLAYTSGTVARFVATGSLTDGRYGLYRWEMPANAGGASGHFHRTFSEAFYVLDGTPSFFDGTTWAPGGPGDYLYVPEGGIHGFRNDAPTPATFLILFAPGIAREAYFEELAQIGNSGRTMTRADWSDLYARHDQVMVE
jgi:mannose-6-phosphate isomerase-like protein (cupin superfamily)